MLFCLVVSMNACCGKPKLEGRWLLPDDDGYIIFDASGEFTWLRIATISLGTWRADEGKVYFNPEKILDIPRG